MKITCSSFGLLFLSALHTLLVRQSSSRLLVCCLAAWLSFPLSAFAQGSLTPPAGPAPTMKSLDQIASTAIPMNSTNTPGDGVSNHFIISNPGSYYLTGNLVVTEANAIRITAAGVTVDLNGFQVSTTNATPNDGVTIRPGADHCTIKNGSFIGFAQGIDTITQTAKNCHFLDIAASSCTNWGIRAGEGAVLESCRAHDCSGASAAIGAGVGSTLRDCTASHNGTVNAIQALAGSTLINCTASDNTGTNGISVGDGSSLTNCTASSNVLHGTTFSAITTGNACTLNNCAVLNNIATFGINAGDHCALSNCTATGNSSTNGIHAGNSNSLSNCVASNNTATNGVSVGNGCSLLNCSAAFNTSNAATSAGINTGTDSIVTNCSAANTQSTSGTPANSTGRGFNVGASSVVKACTAYNNTGDGINVNDSCQVIDSTADANGSASGGNGIVTTDWATVRHCSASGNKNSGFFVGGESLVLENRASNNFSNGIDTTNGSATRVEGNFASSNRGTGILTNFAVVTRNTATNNGTNYNPSSGTIFGTLQSPNAATNPMANIQF